jgi:hypothetical protein
MTPLKKLQGFWTVQISRALVRNDSAQNPSPVRQKRIDVLRYQLAGHFVRKRRVVLKVLVCRGLIQYSTTRFWIFGFSEAEFVHVRGLRVRVHIIRVQVQVHIMQLWRQCSTSNCRGSYHCFLASQILESEEVSIFTTPVKTHARM